MKHKTGKACLQGEVGVVWLQCSLEIATICAMMSVSAAIFYRPKDKAVYADNAHKLFHQGNVGDHLALMNVFNSWEETNFSTQWCYENYVQVGHHMLPHPAC